MFKQIIAFRGKSWQLLIAIILFTFSAGAQTLDTSRVRQGLFANPGYDYIGIGTSKTLRPPQDTIPQAARDNGAIAIKNGILYIWNGGSYASYGKVKQLTDSSFIIGSDTITIHGTGSGGSDSTIYSTNYRRDTAIANVRTEISGKQATGNYITATTGDVVATGPGSVTATIQNNVVSNGKLRQSAALSVIGNSTNSTANVADITAGSDNQVLRRSGTGIGFGAVNLASSNAVTGVLPIGNTDTSSTNHLVTQSDLNDTSSALRAAIGAGAGGTPGGSDTYVQINDAGSLGGNSGFTYNKTMHRIVIGDSAYTSSRIIIVDGDSWTAGANSSKYYFGYAQQIASMMSASPLISGNIGQSLHNVILSVLGRIPTYNASLHQLYVLEYGINDSRTGVTTSDFTADVVRVIDTLVARGWPSNKIMILSPGFEGATNNTITFPFVAAAQAGVTNAGAGIFVDGYSYMQNNGGYSLVASDSVHPNDAGHLAYATAAMLAIPESVQPSGWQRINGSLSVGGPYMGPGQLSVFGKDLWVNGWFIGKGSANLSQNFLITTTPDSAMTGNNNMVAGYGAFGTNTSGNSNTGWGRLIFQTNTTGSNNSAFGNAALQTNTTGGNNTASGWGALNSNTTGSNNSAFGLGALQRSNSDNQSAFGYNALTSSTTSSQNSAFGGSALNSCTTGSSNSAFGINAGYSGTTFSHITAMGASALFGTTGSENTGVGYVSMFNISTGANNTAVGSQSLYTDGTTASTNVSGSLVLGYQAQCTQNNSGILGGLGLNSIRVGIDMVAPAAYLHLPLSDGVSSFGQLKMSDVSIATTAATGNGTSATLTFASQAFPPFNVGSKITVSGLTPSGYNGTFTVTGCTKTAVTFLNTTTGSQSVAGTIESNVLMATPENGLMERQAEKLYWTGRALTRYGIAFNNAANTWSDNQNFTGATTTVADQSTSDSSQSAANTRTVKQMIAAAPGGGTTLASGTYTPTLTNETNITSSTAYQCQYMRVGNVVTVSGKITVDYTATGIASIGISLPIASSISNNYEVAGVAHAEVNPGGVIRGDATNDRAQFYIDTGSSAAYDYFFTFTYVIQ